MCFRPLGELKFLRLWHDNAGKGDGASWYCDFVAIVDLQTKVKYNFIVEKWLAVEEGDGLVDRVIPVAGALDRLRLYYVFSHKVKSDASDKHLWASVFTRPAHSRFTRVERVACCLLALFLTMVSSCMFYKNEGPAVVDFEFAIGPFALTPYVAYTGAVTCLITFVPVTLVIMLFRNSKLRASHSALLRGVVEDHLDEELDYDTCEIVEGHAQPYLDRVLPHYSSLEGTKDNQPPPYSESPEPIEKKSKEKKLNIRKSEKFSLPWQTRILAWFLLIGAIAASVGFTTFYGISFGDAACKQWLSSLFVSFFMDLCLTQPVKVIFFAIFFAVICKSKADTSDFDFVEEDDALMNTLGRRYRLNFGEEYLHEEILRGKIESYVIRPPDQEALERARAYRQKQRQMYDILRELLFFFIFFTLLVIVSNGFRDPMAMRLRESLASLFFSGDDFEEINSVDRIWEWFESTLLPNLRASRWYNGAPPLGQRGFIGDRKNRIMGYATIRQVHSCTVTKEMKPLFNECFSQYHLWDQDERDYLPGWIPTQLAHNDLPLQYRYTRAVERDGFFTKGQLGFYSGGGYVHELRGSSSQLLNEIQNLHKQGWIDHRTRAVIVEMATFNPGSHLFGIIVIKFELPGTGGVIPSFRIEPANLLSFSISNVKAFELACQILFVIALLVMLIKEIRNLFLQRLHYFSTFQAWAQMFIIFCSFGAIAIYAYIITEVKKLTLEFYRSNGNGYANFQMVANWNETLSYLVALVTFVAILMLMHILRFDKNIGLLGSVLRYANRDMKYFFIVFAIIFFSFVVTFYLLFFDTMTAYSTMISSMETSFQIVLGKFDVKGMYEREPVLGPMVFATFSLFIIFIMLSMFVAILTDSFEVVRRDPTLQSHDHEMVQFMIASFILWSGLDRFKWTKSYLDAYSLSLTEQLYKDDEEQECEKIIAEFNEVADQFIGCVKRSELVGLRDT
uniref:Polycystic kidney disease protein n=1 Tax=Echinococcus granulosus TaxID=6210 RepID=A0A068WJ18_ECHGR|nr:Polycystic kidney disease protein [Echinococcus granulosus]